MSSMIPVDVNDPFLIPEDVKAMPDAPRAVIAFELRKTGASYDLIAEKLGYKNGNSAKTAVLKRIRDHYKASEKDVEEVVAMELERLDHLQLIAWKDLQENRNLKAIDQILKIMERRAKLMGLDKSDESTGNVTQQVAIVLGGTENEYIGQVREAREMLNGSRKSS